jgi:RNA polymerase sigma-70 factor, ECF subfamily
MMDVLVADLATETVDVDVELAQEAAVGHPLIDNLARAAVAGNIAARDQLFGELYPLVLRYCRNRLRRHESVFGSADDVAQEVCLAVTTALRSYTISGRSFRSFVFAIAAHKTADAFRAMGRNRAEPAANLPEGPTLHAPVLEDDPEQRLLAGERADQLGALLQLLTPRQRNVLFLRIVVGLSAEETAEQLGSSPGAVRVTQHRALGRLRAVVSRANLKDDGGDEGPPAAAGARHQGAAPAAIAAADRVA